MNEMELGGSHGRALTRSEDARGWEGETTNGRMDEWAATKSCGGWV